MGQHHSIMLRDFADECTLPMIFAYIGEENTLIIIDTFLYMSQKYYFMNTVAVSLQKARPPQLLTGDTRACHRQFI